MILRVLLVIDQSRLLTAERCDNFEKAVRQTEINITEKMQADPPTMHSIFYSVNIYYAFYIYLYSSPTFFRRWQMPGSAPCLILPHTAPIYRHLLPPPRPRTIHLLGIHSAPEQIDSLLNDLLAG